MHARIRFSSLWLMGWLACVAGTANAAVAGGVLDAIAQYQGSISPSSTTHGDPGSATNTATAGPGGFAFTIDEGVDLYDGAIADGRSNLPGSIGAYSHAGGYSPGFNDPPDFVRAQSSVTQTTNWIATTSDPSILSAQINLLVFYHGSLLAASYGGASQPGQVFASVSTRLSTASSLGMVDWFAADATLDRFGGLTTGGGLVAGPPSADWASSFVNSTVSPFAVTYFTSNYVEFFAAAITVPTNEIWSMDSLIATDAFIHGAYENWAVSDFFASGSFELSIATPGVQLTALSGVVPIPAALWLLAPALTGVLLRRRPL